MKKPDAPERENAALPERIPALNAGIRRSVHDNAVGSTRFPASRPCRSREMTRASQHTDESPAHVSRSLAETDPSVREALDAGTARP